jgi:hypothetical protein
MTSSPLLLVLRLQHRQGNIHVDSDELTTLRRRQIPLFQHRLLTCLIPGPIPRLVRSLVGDGKDLGVHLQDSCV